MTESQYVLNRLRFDWTDNEVNFYRAVEKLTGGRVTSSRDGSRVKCHFDLVIDNPITLGQYIDRDALRHFSITRLSTRLSAEMTVGVNYDKSSNWLVLSNSNQKVMDQTGFVYVCKFHTNVTSKNLDFEFQKIINDPNANLQNDKSGIAIMIGALKEQVLRAIAPEIQERYRYAQFNRMACRLLGIQESDHPSPEMQPFLSSLQHMHEIYSFMRLTMKNDTHMERHIMSVISDREAYMEKYLGKK